MNWCMEGFRTQEKCRRNRTHLPLKRLFTFPFVSHFSKRRNCAIWLQKQDFVSSFSFLFVLKSHRRSMFILFFFISFSFRFQCAMFCGAYRSRRETSWHHCLLEILQLNCLWHFSSTLKNRKFSLAQFKSYMLICTK